MKIIVCVVMVLVAVVAMVKAYPEPKALAEVGPDADALRPFYYYRPYGYPSYYHHRQKRSADPDPEFATAVATGIVVGAVAPHASELLEDGWNAYVGFVDDNVHHVENAWRDIKDFFGRK